MIGHDDPAILVSVALGVAKDYVKRNLVSKRVLERDAARAEIAAAIVAAIRSQYDLVPKDIEVVGPPRY